MKKPTIQKKQEFPEILYESPSYPGEETTPIPYIESDKNNPMPQALVIFEYFETGEVEPDERGKPAKIVDQIPHMYIDTKILEQVLTKDELHRVRLSLGMKPIEQAKKEGQVILDNVMKKQEELTNKARETQQERIEAHKATFEKVNKNTEN
jgi:hypothetical protein